MTANGLGLGEVGEIEAQMFNKPLMLIEVRMFKFSTSAPILPNPSYVCKSIKNSNFPKGKFERTKGRLRYTNPLISRFSNMIIPAFLTYLILNSFIKPESFC
jgi:hypothetical protein